MVLPQNYLFLRNYIKFREYLLRNKVLNLIAKLGSGAFATISGEVVKVVLSIVSHDNSISEQIYDNQGDKHHMQIAGIDVSNLQSIDEKVSSILVDSMIQTNQIEQLSNPNMIISFDKLHYENMLGEIAPCYQGTSSADNSQFQLSFWEVNYSKGWEYLQNAPTSTSHYSGKELIISWSKLLNSEHGFAIRGREAWGKSGVCVAPMATMPSAIFTGHKYTDSAPAIIPKHEMYLSSIFAFAESGELVKLLRKMNPNLRVNNGYFNNIPFDDKYWNDVAKKQYPNGLPLPYSEDPTQWIFHGHPCDSVIWDDATKWTKLGKSRSDETVLHVAIARLIGYRWPAELDEKMELSDEARELVKRCDSLLPYAHEDGLVCIPSVSGEKNAEERLRALLAEAFGSEWSPGKLGELLDNVDFSGKSLEDWLRNGFFQQHCKLFHHRPFIWQIWDGLKDGFSVLVNYHKLNKSLLERLIYSYLGDWIRRQRDAVDHLEEGAELKLAKALVLERKLKLILKGEYYDKPHEDLRGLDEFTLPVGFDIFVRWKPLHEQPIGWNPDLNDGVRLNIRPFMTAGVLRWKPNINWKKDRGKDVESAPWYELGLEYGGNKGDRINDHHLTLEENLAAREEFKKRKSEL